MLQPTSTDEKNLANKGPSTVYYKHMGENPIEDQGQLQNTVSMKAVGNKQKSNKQ